MTALLVGVAAVVIGSALEWRAARLERRRAGRRSMFSGRWVR